MARQRSLFVILIILVLVMMSSSLLLAYQRPASTETSFGTSTHESWPILRHDNGHTGFNANVGSFRPPLVLSDTIKLKDSSQDPHQIFNLITGPNRIFAMGLQVIWGIAKNNRSVQWRNDDCNNNPTVHFCFISYMAYSADRLVLLRQNILPSFSYDLVVLNSATGKEIWKKSLGMTAPEIALEGSSILVLTEENSSGKLILFSLSGSQFYKKDADISGYPDSRAVSASGRFIYANGDRIIAHRTDNGELAWVYTDSARVDTTRGYDLVATADGVIVSQGERVIRLNASNGTVVWQKNIKPSVCNSTLQPNSAATDGSTIAITAVCDEEVVALNYVNGAEKWRKNIGFIQSPSAIAIGGNVLYVASVVTPQVNIYALNLSNGTELEKLVRSVAESSSVLAISDGLLLTASNLGSKEIKRFERQPADLSAQILLDSTPVCGGMVGGKISFSFIVSNNGPGSSSQTRADLNLPDGTATLTTTQGSCTSGSSPYCDLGSLSKGQEVTINAEVTLAKSGNYSPGISIGSSVRDPNEVNNDSALPQVFNVADLLSGGVDLRARSLEITQGIQNKANDIDLVEGKKTMVRAYARTDDGTVKNVTAILRGWKSGGAEFIESPLTPIPGTQCVTLFDRGPNRDKLNETFVFELPDDWWKDDITLELQVNPEGAIPDTNPSNDKWSQSTSFTKLPRICLKTYPVRTTGTRAGETQETDQLSPNFWAVAADDGNILSRALTMLPVSEIKVYFESNLIEEWEPLSPGGWGPYEMDKDEDNRVDVLDTLDWLWLFSDDPDECDADGSRTHYMGMIDQGTTNTVGSAGLGERPGDGITLFLNTGPNGPQAFDDPHGGLTLAHELGHNYNRLHVECGDPKPKDPGPYPSDRDKCAIAPDSPNSYYGFEFLNPTQPTVITPTMAGDLMSYADDVWTSDFTWEAIQDKLCEANGCSFPSLTGIYSDAQEAPPPLIGPVLVVRGRITPTLEIHDAHILPAAQVPKADRRWAEQLLSHPQNAVYSLDILSGTQVLHSEPFTPTMTTDVDSSTASFSLVIPWDPAGTQIELTQSGSLEDAIVVSTNPPTVTSILPNGGETVFDDLHISWKGSDADGDELSYAVLYSADMGSSWRALATGIYSTSVSIDSSLLPGSNGQSLVKVIASDGINSAYRISASGFSIPDRPPQAFIYFPDHQAVYPHGSALMLDGAVYDPEDGYLSSSAMVWNLSGHGSVGTGNDLVLDDLESGTYTLTLQAKDSAGQNGKKSLKFTIDKQAIEELEDNSLFMPVLFRQ